MREIKFRVWNKTRESMDYDPYRFEMMHGEWIYYEDWQDDQNSICFPCEVMQFTGLKDKNGKEIYEGDIVSYQAKYDPQVILKGKVFWQDFRACFAVGLERSNNDLWKYCQNGNTLEVLGNIYENPELLEVKCSTADTSTT